MTINTVRSNMYVPTLFSSLANVNSQTIVTIVHSAISQLTNITYSINYTVLYHPSLLCLQIYLPLCITAVKVGILTVVTIAVINCLHGIFYENREAYLRESIFNFGLFPARLLYAVMMFFADNNIFFVNNILPQISDILGPCLEGITSSVLNGTIIPVLETAYDDSLIYISFISSYLPDLPLFNDNAKFLTIQLSILMFMALGILSFGVFGLSARHTYRVFYGNTDPLVNIKVATQYLRVCQLYNKQTNTTENPFVAKILHYHWKSPEFLSTLTSLMLFDLLPRREKYECLLHKVRLGNSDSSRFTTTVYLHSSNVERYREQKELHLSPHLPALLLEAMRLQQNGQLESSHDLLRAVLNCTYNTPEEEFATDQFAKAIIDLLTKQRFGLVHFRDQTKKQVSG